jgi:hypothetical protein
MSARSRGHTFNPLAASSEADETILRSAQESQINRMHKQELEDVHDKMWFVTVYDKDYKSCVMNNTADKIKWIKQLKNEFPVIGVPRYSVVGDEKTGEKWHLYMIKGRLSSISTLIESEYFIQINPSTSTLRFFIQSKSFMNATDKRDPSDIPKEILFEIIENDPNLSKHITSLINYCSERHKIYGNVSLHVFKRLKDFLIHVKEYHDDVTKIKAEIQNKMNELNEYMKKSIGSMMGMFGVGTIASDRH